MSARPDFPNVRLAGLATTAELLATGLTRARLRIMVRRGDLIPVQRGVYLSAEVADRLGSLPCFGAMTTAMATLVTLATGSVISHQTAAEIHGLDLLRRPGAITITRLPGAGSRSGKSGVLVHWAALPPGHVGGRMGMAVTTVPRTVTDLGRSLEFREGVVVADSALHQHLTTKKELRVVLAACPRFPGSRRAAQVIGFADGLAESPLESIARVAFRDHGLPPPELQAEIRGEDGDFIGRVDFLWRQFRTIAEVDGAIKYADPARAKAQLRRDRRLREAGYEVVHFDWRDITARPQEVAASIRAAFRRGGRLGQAGRPA